MNNTGKMTFTVPPSLASLDFSGVDGVVFDFGGVISVAPLDPITGDWSLYDYGKTIGLTREILKKGWDDYRHLWDGGFITFKEMYERIFASAGVELTPKILDELWEVDTVGWVRNLRSDTLELMRSLKSAGFKIGILSNMSLEFYERLYLERAAEYRAVADMEVISALEKMYKPKRPIYDLAEKRMGIPASRLLFLDDMPANIAAARSYGWNAMVYPPPPKAGA